MDDIGERLREDGWRQGIIVPASYLLEGLPDGSPATEVDHAMVVSQSCDLVHHSLDNEPSALILVLKKIDSGSIDLMHGRSPRQLHFQSIDGPWFEAWAWNQVVIPRDHLAGKAALKEIQLAPRTLRTVLDWLAKRFTRIAFPDGFNDSLKAKSGAIGKLLKKTGWDVKSVDLWEVNEAFAAVTMAAMSDFGLPHEIVNVHGGACALGHPIGASGARIVVTLLGALRNQGLKRGVAALCIGGGEATALAVELI